MCRTALVGLAAFALLIASPSQAQDPAGLSAEDAAAIRSNLEFLSIDIDPLDAPEEFFSRFTEDVHWNFRDLSVVDGLDALREDVEWCHKISGEFTPSHMEGSGDLAYVVGAYQVSLDCGDEEAFDSEGTFVSIHRRGSDGTWRIAVYVAGE